MKNTTILTSFIVLISLSSITGQADSILSLPLNAQGQALFAWYENRIPMDSSAFFPILDQLHHDFDQADRQDLVREVRRIRIFYTTAKYYAWDPKALEIIDREIEWARDKGWLVDEAELLMHRGQFNMNFSRYVHAFENFIKGYEIMKEIGTDQFAYPHKWLASIGVSYYKLGATEQATHFIQEALAAPRHITDDGFIMITKNNLGLCYSRQMKYDSAILAFQESNAIAVKHNSLAYVAVTNGNMGFAYFKKGDDEKALPLLEDDFNLSNTIHEIGSATNASLSLSTIYLKKGNRPKAEFYIQYSKKHVERANDKQMKAFYDNLSEFSKIMKDYQSALTYKDSADYYHKRVLSAEEKDIIERARLELEIEKHIHAMSSLEAERKKQILARNAILITLVFTGIVGSMMIHKRFLRRKRELELAQRELNQFTDMVREKNELLVTFSQEIEHMKSVDQHMTDERTKHLTELIHSHILTEEDWKQFRILFDKVHPGFFIRLKEKMPDLTSAETRLLALTKLQLAPREMASMLGISYDSILKSRQRLRKKINLPEEGSLDELLEMI